MVKSATHPKTRNSTSSAARKSAKRHGKKEMTKSTVIDKMFCLTSSDSEIKWTKEEVHAFASNLIGESTAEWDKNEAIGAAHVLLHGEPAYTLDTTEKQFFKALSAFAASDSMPPPCDASMCTEVRKPSELLPLIQPLQDAEENDWDAKDVRRLIEQLKRLNCVDGDGELSVAFEVDEFISGRWTNYVMERPHLLAELDAVRYS